MAKRKSRTVPLDVYQVKDKILAANVVAAAVEWHQAMPGSDAWASATERLAKATVKLRAWRQANDRDDLGNPVPRQDRSVG